jgi:hypothetical protein
MAGEAEAGRKIGDPTTPAAAECALPILLPVPGRSGEDGAVPCALLFPLLFPLPPPPPPPAPGAAVPPLLELLLFPLLSPFTCVSDIFRCCEDEETFRSSSCTSKLDLVLL